MNKPAKAQVIIVEDNVATNNLLRDWLKLSFAVVCFLDAESTRRLLSPSDTPMVFIVDYNLPGDNGLQLKEKIQDKFPAAKWVLISGLFDETLTKAAHEAGYDLTLSKPFTMPQLSEHIRNLLGLPAEKTNLVEMVKREGGTA